MGYLQNGVWHQGWYDTTQSGGEFVRGESSFRSWITPDGSSAYRAEPDRYHLYVSLACPWAHRTLIFRRLMRLEAAVSVSVVHPHMGENGWEFKAGDACGADDLYGFQYLYQVYLKANPKFTGRVTVPVLWDKQTLTIVNNESSEIIRMLNSAFAALTPVTDDYYPERLRAEIDRINDFVYEHVNNGVYRCGFAGSQGAYERAFDELFSALDELDARLARQRYLAGGDITEADWRLFTTLVRFDAVYYSHFKCNLRRIEDYANLSNYLRALYQFPGVAETVNFDHIKRHYYGSHTHLNPSGIVPKGPTSDFTRRHDRDRFAAGRRSARA
jgi:putative glutathione S-transferase